MSWNRPDWKDRSPDDLDLYDLAGRPRFDPDRLGVLTDFKSANRELHDYQNHASKQIAGRAREWQLALAKARKVLENPEALREAHRDLLGQLRERAQNRGLPFEPSVIQGWLARDERTSAQLLSRAAQAIISGNDDALLTPLEALLAPTWPGETRSSDSTLVATPSSKPAFDPYYTWLGIAPEEQPADHYRLLAIRKFEANAVVISNASDRLLAHLRTYQTGPHAAESQKLLNEISAATRALLDPVLKAAYDQQLGQTVRAPASRFSPTAEAPAAYAGNPLFRPPPPLPALPPALPVADLLPPQAGGSGIHQRTPAAAFPVALPVAPAPTVPQGPEYRLVADLPTPLAPVNHLRPMPALPPIPLPQVDTHSPTLQHKQLVMLSVAGGVATVMALAVIAIAVWALRPGTKPPRDNSKKTGNAEQERTKLPVTAPPAAPAPGPTAQTKKVVAIPPAAIPPSATNPVPTSVTQPPALVSTPAPEGLAPGFFAQGNAVRVVVQGWRPTWSPDGQRLVFTFPASEGPAGRLGLGQLVLRTGESTTLVQRGRDPVWSPDGNWIAYVRGLGDGPDPSDVVWLFDYSTRQEQEIGPGQLPHWIAGSNQLAFWSPQRASLVTVDPRAAIFVPETWQVNPRGTSSITTSPDGRYVAGSVNKGGHWELSVYEMVGGALPPMLAGRAGGIPAWDISSKRIAVSARAGMDRGLWVVDPFVQQEFQVAEGAWGCAAWSPDGRWLACDYRPTAAGQNSEIWLLDAKSLAPGAAPFRRGAVPPGTSAIAGSSSPNSIPFGGSTSKPAGSVPFGGSTAGPATVPASGSTSTLTNSIGMKFVRIEPGEFLMGQGSDEALQFAASPYPNDKSIIAERKNHERQHKVRLTKPFMMGVTEVTQGQWKAIMASSPWAGGKQSPSGDDYPATHIPWKDAVLFCTRLSQKDGQRFRLPTEAEWEYCCRAGATTVFGFGDDLRQLGEYAWERGNANDRPGLVGVKKPNRWGLHDMHGNVWEWCSDWYAEYPVGDATDPQGPLNGQNHTVRGGGYWSIFRSDYRSASRRPGLDGHPEYGLRVVMDPAGPANVASAPAPVPFGISPPKPGSIPFGGSTPPDAMPSSTKPPSSSAPGGAPNVGGRTKISPPPMVEPKGALAEGRAAKLHELLSNDRKPTPHIYAILAYSKFGNKYQLVLSDEKMITQLVFQAKGSNPGADVRKSKPFDSLADAQDFIADESSKKAMTEGLIRGR